MHARHEVTEHAAQREACDALCEGLAGAGFHTGLDLARPRKLILQLRPVRQEHARRRIGV